MHVVVVLLHGPPDERTEVVLAAQRHSGPGMCFEIGEVDQIGGLGEAERHVVRGDAWRATTPIQRLCGRLDLDTSEFAGVVHILHIRKLPVQNLVVLRDQVCQRVAHADVGLGHAHDPDELAQECNDHLRRRVHVILTFHERVRVRIDRTFPPDHSHPVRLDHDLLAGLVGSVRSSLPAVEVPKQIVPRARHRALPRELTDSPRHHGIDAVLLGVVGLVPVPVLRPLPIGHVRVVYPDDATRMNALRLADRLERFGGGRRRARQPTCC